jgi:hypothetical protein
MPQLNDEHFHRFAGRQHFTELWPQRMKVPVDHNLGRLLNLLDGATAPIRRDSLIRFLA